MARVRSNCSSISRMGASKSRYSMGIRRTLKVLQGIQLDVRFRGLFIHVCPRTIANSQSAPT
jgi:hypothetical protein